MRGTIMGQYPLSLFGQHAHSVFAAWHQLPKILDFRPRGNHLILPDMDANAENFAFLSRHRHLRPGDDSPPPVT